MSSFTNKTPFISPENGEAVVGSTNWGVGNGRFPCSYNESLAVQSDVDVERRLGLLQNRQDAMALHLDQSYRSGTESYLDSSQLDYSENNGSTSPLESRRKHRSGAPRPRFEVVSELGPEEVRWFYKEDKKTWKPFVGHDSLRIELMYRELNPDKESSSGHAVPDGEDPCDHASAVASVQSSEQLDETDLDISIEAVCVRGGLYEVDVREKECYPVYWNRECSPLVPS